MKVRPERLPGRAPRRFTATLRPLRAAWPIPIDSRFASELTDYYNVFSRVLRGSCRHSYLLHVHQQFNRLVAREFWRQEPLAQEAYLIRL